MYMRTLLSLVVLLVLTAPTCSLTGSDANGPLTIVHGTSFGMCGGYCRSMLEIDSATARLTQVGRDSIRYPRKTRSLELTEAEWRRLKALANVEDLSAVAGVHGCPDCADGGAEWIAIQKPDRTIQTTYEYGSDLERIAELQQQLRAIRQRFP
jgi:hypothetical protein